MKIFIGTSGYSYFHWWDGVFYPADLPQHKWLEYYCQHFDTVELNNTFYRLPNEKTFKSWYERTPKNFIFAVKVNRYITGIKRLTDVNEALKLFLRRVDILKEKLGVLLFQFPPNFKLNFERLKEFLKILPNYYRSCFEFRHKTWFVKEVYELLHRKNISFCIADWPNFDISPEITGDFLYIRRHGVTQNGRLYSNCYTNKELKDLVRLVKRYNLDAYIYFNNDAYGYAVKNAMELKNML